MKVLIRLVTVAAAALVIPLAGIATATSAGAATPAITKITVSVTPNPVTEVGASEVNAVVQVEALAGFAGDSVNISSIDLTNSCESVEFNSIAAGVPFTADNPISVVLDNEGNATVEVDAVGCSPGTDVIEADLASVPYKTATTTLTVNGPNDTPHGVWASPTKEVETGTSGEGGDSDVYAVFNVETSSKYSEQTVEIQSDELVDRCGAGSEWVTNVDTFADSTTATAVLDDNGNATFTFYGVSCATGASTVIADVEAGLHPKYTTSFRVLSPRVTI
jgi:hypothetical protein